jgi:hypothetical protein
LESVPELLERSQTRALVGSIMFVFQTQSTQSGNGHFLAYIPS